MFTASHFYFGCWRWS